MTHPIDYRMPEKWTEDDPLHVWAAKHADHGRGPWQDAKVHVYYTWRCSCGARWQCTEQEMERNPQRCALKAVK